MPWRTVRSSEPQWREPIPLARCVACGTAVTEAAVPADAHEGGAYGGGAPRLSGLAAPVLQTFDRRRLRIARGLVPPPGRLVDAGAGRGRFVAAARAAGYDATGIEPSDRGVRAAAQRYGIALEQSPLEAAAPGATDVVTLWHVLEHVDDPRAALRSVGAWLRPGGGLVLGVPNLASWQARIGGPRWYHLDVPRHRTHFTEQGVRAILAATGFEVVHVGHVLAEHNPFGMWQSAVNRVTRTPSYFFNLLKRNAPLLSPDLAVTALALPLIPVAAVAELIAGLARRGGTIAVGARRI